MKKILAFLVMVNILLYGEAPTKEQLY